MLSRGPALALGAGLAVLLGGGTSQARDLPFGGAHAAYGLGGATGPYRGFRQNLDLALFPVLLVMNRGRYIQTDSGLTAGASAVLGFGAYPSYASFEVGPAFSSIAGGVATLGPVWRFGSEKFAQGSGVQLRLSVDFFLVEVGLRVIKIVSGQGETQATLAIGVGRF